jgi:hypothetical protein
MAVKQMYILFYGVAISHNLGTPSVLHSRSVISAGDKEIREFAF